MMPLPTSPSVGRPAQGFTTQRAQRWVLGAAILIAVTYAFRRIVEPSVTTSPARGGTAKKIAGAGSPPPPLGQWAVAYGAGFLLLSVMSLGAPEVAASLAALTVAGSFLTNGTTIVADIAGLEGAHAPSKSSGVGATAANALTSQAAAVGSAAALSPAGNALAGQGVVTGIGQVTS